MPGVFYPAARAILHVVFDGFGTSDRDTDAKTIHVLPKSVTVNRNSYHQPDTWQLTFDAYDLPIDPSLIRAGAAEVYLFELPGVSDEQKQLSRQFAATDANDAARGRSALDALQIGQGDQRAAEKFAFRNRPMVAGLFDDLDVEMSDAGRWVTISGQDYTALLAGKQWPPAANGTARRIPTGKRLDLTVQDILAQADPEHRLTVVVEGLPASSLPVVGARDLSGNARGIPIEAETSYWDVIYKTVTRYGFITFVRGLDVVISKPKNVEQAAAHDIKRMAWGANLSELQLTRHLGKLSVPRIVVRAYDPRIRKTVSVEYPETSPKAKIAKRSQDRLTQKLTTEKPKERPKATKKSITKEDEYTIVTISVPDPAVMRATAETLHQIMGKSEREMIVRTRDLRDLGGRGLLELNVGDAVDVRFDDFDESVIGDPEIPEAAKYQHLVARGYNADVASVIAQHYTKFMQHHRPMRVREASFEFDVDRGIDIEMVLQDFVVVGGVRGDE